MEAEVPAGGKLWAWRPTPGQGLRTTRTTTENALPPTLGRGARGHREKKHETGLTFIRRLGKYPRPRQGQPNRKGPPMLPRSLDPKEMAFYVMLGQVGMEMVAPLVVGLLLDHWLGWTPWLTVIGAVMGFVGGLGHLVALLNQKKKPDADDTPRQPS